MTTASTAVMGGMCLDVALLRLYQNEIDSELRTVQLSLVHVQTGLFGILSVGEINIGFMLLFIAQT